MSSDKDFIEQVRRALIKLGIADPLLSQAEVCQILHLSPSTLARMRKEGSGPEWLRVGGSIRYQKSAVIAFIARSQTW
jgi:predicted DNA-binding transcriptional regulator AlpA